MIDDEKALAAYNANYMAGMEGIDLTLESQKEAESIIRATAVDIGREVVRNNQAKRLLRQLMRLKTVKKEK